MARLDAGGGAAPMPKAPDGTAGSWQLVIARSTDPYLRIPAGGSEHRRDRSYNSDNK